MTGRAERGEAGETEATGGGGWVAVLEETGFCFRAVRCCEGFNQTSSRKKGRKPQKWSREITVHRGGSSGAEGEVERCGEGVL